ncbi:radical SAM protein [Dehalobacter sp. TeCB1]|uniref:radical SAM/SPASM domain-containing protein n=1 Tax=Dehalobacter sp. TeCB1 TaxID=1843715 RepID=UPI00083A3B9A|nr:radical SAM protein [Dehalobacter sp. TeCB1]OCZ49876.1 radical SAM/SPASM domain-containing protein [Dehalobacter sp. TeCB1]
MNLISKDELHQFRKYNNRYERQLRSCNYRLIMPGMNASEILEVIDDNKRMMFSSSLKQFERHKDLFKNDIDFRKMDAIENIGYPDTTTLIVKTTHACNLHCPYCYDVMFRKDLNAEGNIISLDLVKQLLKVFKDENIGSWIWHGGEPLLIDKDFYETANDLIRRQFKNVDICMQSNLTLIDDDNAAMLSKFNIRPGFSFDGLTNHLTRKNTGQLMKSLALADKYGVMGGAIIILTKDNIQHMIEEYEYFKRLGIGCKMNLIFSASKNENTYTLEGKVVAKELCKFFDYWIEDTYRPADSDICERYLRTALEAGGSCNFADCASNWFSTQPDGTIYHCGRDWPENASMSFGNIFDMESVQDILNHPNHQRWIEGTRRMLENCSDCDFYFSCHCGCFNDNLQYDLSMNKPEPENCYIHRQVISHIIRVINEIDFDDMPKYNPRFLNFLFTNQFRSAKMIRKILDESIKLINAPVKAENKLKEFLVV